MLCSSFVIFYGVDVQTMNKEQAATLLANVLGKEVSTTDISLEDVVAVGLDGKPLGLCRTEGYLMFPTKPEKVIQFSGQLHTPK